MPRHCCWSFHCLPLVDFCPPAQLILLLRWSLSTIVDLVKSISLPSFVKRLDHYCPFHQSLDSCSPSFLIADVVYPSHHLRLSLSSSLATTSLCNAPFFCLFCVFDIFLLLTTSWFLPFVGFSWGFPMLWWKFIVIGFVIIIYLFIYFLYLVWGEWVLWWKIWVTSWKFFLLTPFCVDLKLPASFIELLHLPEESFFHKKIVELQELYDYLSLSFKSYTII